MNLYNKKIWFTLYVLCCLSPYVYDQWNNNVQKDTMVIVNKAGTPVKLTITQEFNCPGKEKSIGKQHTTIFSLTETIPFDIPQDMKNCSVVYQVNLKMDQWEINKDYSLTDINDYQYQIYDGRQGEAVLQAVPWKDVRPDVIVQGVH